MALKAASLCPLHLHVQRITWCLVAPGFDVRGSLQECQANADRTFLIALAVPLAAAAAAAAYLLRPPPQELKESGQVFEDETTGFVFQVPEDGTGERGHHVMRILLNALGS